VGGGGRIYSCLFYPDDPRYIYWHSHWTNDLPETTLRLAMSLRDSILGHAGVIIDCTGGIRKNPNVPYPTHWPLLRIHWHHEAGITTKCHQGNLAGDSSIIFIFGHE